MPDAKLATSNPKPSRFISICNKDFMNVKILSFKIFRSSVSLKHRGCEGVPKITRTSSVNPGDNRHNWSNALLDKSVYIVDLISKESNVQNSIQYWRISYFARFITCKIWECTLEVFSLTSPIMDKLVGELDAIYYHHHALNWDQTWQVFFNRKWTSSPLPTPCHQLHSKTPHVVTVLWLDSDDVVTILSSTRNLVEGYKTVYLCHLDSYTVTVYNGYLVSSNAVTVSCLLGA